MTPRLRDQDGWAVVTAVVLMSIMLTIALAAIAFVDSETRSSRRERTAETRLNLTEGVVATELYRLSRNWPDTAGKAYVDCTNTTTDAMCPHPAQVRAQFSGVDFRLDPTWKVQVRDDDDAAAVTGQSCSGSAAPGFYSDAAILGREHYDANRNCQIWVRAEGRLEGRQRVVVAKVRVENRAPVFPAAPFVAGSFNTSNNGGSKVIVNGNGVQGTVRCSSGTACADWNGQQVGNPGSVAMGDPNVGGTALDPAMVDALRQMAKARGTYYATCSNANPNGDVVFVESGNCSFTAGTPTIGGAVNGGTKKGIFVVNNGTLKLSGNLVWYGAIYMVNAQGCGSVATASCINGKYGDTVVDLSGTGTVYGGIYVDGSGRLQAGSSGNAGAGNAANLVYDSTVVPDVTAYGTAGIIQNTWRELTAG
jgi:hypothetical protein